MVDGAALADVLDNLQAGLTFTNSLGVEYLVNAAWIFSLAPLKNFVINIATRALTTHSIDTMMIFFAFAKHGVDIEELIRAASIAVVVGA